MNGRVRADQERRRSGAAGRHEDRRTRAEIAADALEHEDRAEGPDVRDAR